MCAGAERLRWSGPPEMEDNPVTVITSYKLSYLSRGELHALQRLLHRHLFASEAGSAERRDTLASLENIQRELMRRMIEAPAQWR